MKPAVARAVGGRRGPDAADARVRAAAVALLHRGARAAAAAAARALRRGGPADAALAEVLPPAAPPLPPREPEAMPSPESARRPPRDGMPAAPEFAQVRAAEYSSGSPGHPQAREGVAGRGRAPPAPGRGRRGRGHASLRGALAGEHAGADSSLTSAQHTG